MAEVVPNPLFRDQAVLQRSIPVPVWGTAAPGEAISVRYREHEEQTRADANGDWIVRLPALSVGASSDLVIEGTNTLTFSDVVVGDVWIGSGQSNMWGPGYGKEDPALVRAVEKGPYPDIRLYVSPEDMRGENAPRWGKATAGNIGRFSALLFSFGHTLHQELDVPVGLILAAVNGSPSGAWISESAMAADPKIQEQVRNYREGVYARMASEHKRQREAYDAAVAAGKSGLKKPTPPRNPVKSASQRLPANTTNRWSDQ